MQLASAGGWRAFASSRYRPFHAISIGQAFTGSLACDSLFVPLLLRLGAPAWMVILIGTSPIAGSILQARLPTMLRRMHGDLRRLTLLFALSEVRGFVYAAIVAATAIGAISVGVAIALVSLTVFVGQAVGLLSAWNISLWTAVVLSEEERRLVGPRMGAVQMGLSTAILLPAGFMLDAATASCGLWAYVAFYVLGGAVPIITPIAVLRLPRPGRVHVPPAPASKTEEPPGVSRFIRSATIAAFGQGVLPYLSMYAISVLHLSAGFAVILSGVSYGGSLIGSLFAGSFLLEGSASRLLRASFALRTVAAALCALSLPGNPLAPAMLIAGAALFSVGGNAGALALNERLYRLVPQAARVHYQGVFVATSSMAVVSGATVSATALAIAMSPVWLPYFALFVMSGVSRGLAAISTEVSASWKSPVVATEPRPPIPSKPAACATSVTRAAR